MFKDKETSWLLERRAQIAKEVDNEGADLKALDEEIRGINAELEARKAAEAERRALRDKVAQGAGVVIETAPRGKEKRDIAEFRNSKEYVDMYAEYMKTGDDTEIRAALLTTNATGGTIAVPDFVYEIVKTAWDRNEIMSLVSRADVPGNLEVNFEIEGDDAVIHTEGSGAVDEEALTEGIVQLVPEFAKKWKSFSKNVYRLRGEAFVRYIYDEIAYRILKVIADSLVGKIAALPQTATSSSPSAGLVSSAPAIGTVAEALGELSDEATDPVVIMNKKTWSLFKAAQYNGNYAIDPFEGFAVHFNSTLPAYADANEDEVYMIVGDLRQGALANFPNGDEIEFTFDELTRKKENLIEVLGELMFAAAPVADKAFALVAKPGE